MLVLSVLWGVAKLADAPPQCTGSQMSDLEVHHTGNIVEIVRNDCTELRNTPNAYSHHIPDVSSVRDL